MTTVIKTHKSNNKGMLIALAVSAVIAMAIAFYLTTTGHRDDAAIAEAPPAAAAAVADATPAPSAAPVVNR